MKHRRAFLGFWLSLLFLPGVAAAQWLTDGTPICQAAGTQAIPFMTSDGAGGFVIAWYDDRNDTGDIFAQKIDANGTVLWTDGGVPVCLAVGTQGSPSVIADGSGGVILVWSDFRASNADVYAQRLDADGNPLWTTDGVALCTAGGNQTINFRGPLASDGAGGAIVAWTDFRTLTARIYAQRIDAAGTPLWAADGVEVSTSAGGPQVDVVTISDGTGGAMMVWSDRRLMQNNYDIYAQRVNFLGVPQWLVGTTNAVPVCAIFGPQSFPVIAPDGAGGFIAAWKDYRSMNYDIYVQRVSSAGVLQWYAIGMPACTDPNDQSDVVIAEDESGGALLAWHDERPVADASYDIYAQKINSLGNGLWLGNGAPICTNAMRQEEPKIVRDGFGGAFVAWFDQRDGVDWDVYAQHVSSIGNRFWTLDGVPASAPDGDQIVTALVPDGANGAIAAWYDDRDGNYDIYALRLTDATTAVAITSFEANAADGVVSLRAAFRSNLGADAVNIYRGSKSGPLVPIDRLLNTASEEFMYQDAGVTPGETYRYQIGVQDADGEFFSSIATVTVEPLRLELSQNRPNPFNPSTTIHFVLPKSERVSLAIYDANGARVRTLADGEREHGGHDVEWDGRDEHGVRVSSGVYFYRLTAGKHSQTKKMILLK